VRGGLPGEEGFVEYLAWKVFWELNTYNLARHVVRSCSRPGSFRANKDEQTPKHLKPIGTPFYESFRRFIPGCSHRKVGMSELHNLRLQNGIPPFGVLIAFI
jgi:hypothetical protein